MYNLMTKIAITFFLEIILERLSEKASMRELVL